MEKLEGRLPGALFALAGGIGIFFGWDLSVGTLARPGPAVFPLLISVQCVIVGLWLLLRPTEGERIDWSSYKHAFPVLASIVVFSVLIEPAGLLLATTISVLVVLGMHVRSHPLESLLIALATAALVSMIFVAGINLPLELLP